MREKRIVGLFGNGYRAQPANPLLDGKRARAIEGDRIEPDRLATAEVPQSAPHESVRRRRKCHESDRAIERICLGYSHVADQPPCARALNQTEGVSQLGQCSTLARKNLSLTRASSIRDR